MYNERKCAHKAIPGHTQSAFTDLKLHYITYVKVKVIWRSMLSEGQGHRFIISQNIMYVVLRSNVWI